MPLANVLDIVEPILYSALIEGLDPSKGGLKPHMHNVNVIATGAVELLDAALEQLTLEQLEELAPLTTEYPVVEARVNEQIQAKQSVPRGVPQPVAEIVNQPDKNQQL